MDTIAPTTPTEVNASGDFIRGLRFPAKSGPSGMTTSRTGDRLEAFYHRLKGAEGTLRNWGTRQTADKMTYVAALVRPEPEKNETPEAFKERFDFWRTALLGVLDMELMQDAPDLLVAQSALDSFRLPKTGKR